MAPRIGRMESVGIAKESSRGVGVAAQYTLPRMGYSFRDKTNKALSTETLGHISGNGAQTVATLQFAEGNIDGEINANSFGILLLALFGSEVVTTVSGAKKHTLSLTNSNQHNTLSIHLDDAIQDRIFEGCALDSMEININPEDFVKFTAGFKGKKGQDSSFTPAPAADYKFAGRDATIKVAADTASLAAASGLSLKEFNITFSKNADYDPVLGTLEPENIPNKQLVIQGSMVLNYEDNTVREYMINNTYRALSVLLNNTRDAIGSNTPQLYLEFPVCDFFEWEVESEPDDIVTQTVNFRALLDLSTGTARLISDAYIINNANAY